MSIETRRELANAIEAHIRSLGDDDSVMLVDFVMQAKVTSLSLVDSRRSRYFTMYSENCDSDVAIGLSTILLNEASGNTLEDE